MADPPSPILSSFTSSPLSLHSPYVKDLKDGIRSRVRIDFKGQVHKKFRGHQKAERCENEARILKALEERACPYVPRLLDYQPQQHYIVTSNCGQPAPDISRTKSDALFACLERDYGVRHDDPEPRNVTYCSRLGRFCLIDFELSELLPEPAGSQLGPRGIWKVTWSSLSEGGIMRDSNDDAYLALEVGPQGTHRFEAHGEALLEPSHLVLAVSDGMGGGSAGELASRLILASVKRRSGELYEALRQHAGQEGASLLRQLIQNTHEGLNSFAAEDASLQGMGATLTLVWLSPGHLHFAHLGDSRLYLHRSGETSQITNDHTEAWCQWRRGEISEFAYRSHPRRSALYEALGGGHPSIRPQIESHPLQDGDRLLLCTDGIIDGIWERGLATELEGNGESADLAPRILRRARDNSRDDDATLIVAKIAQL